MALKYHLSEVLTLNISMYKFMRCSSFVDFTQNKIPNNIKLAWCLQKWILFSTFEVFLWMKSRFILGIHKKQTCYSWNNKQPLLKTSLNTYFLCDNVTFPHHWIAPTLPCNNSEGSHNSIHIKTTTMTENIPPASNYTWLVRG